METKLVETIVSQGVLGVLLVLAVLALWKKDRELADERARAQKDLTEAMRGASQEMAALRDRKDAEIAAARERHAKEIAEVNERRVNDVGALNGIALATQDKALTAIHRLADVAEAQQQRRSA